MSLLFPNRCAYIYCLPYHPMSKDAEDFRYLSIKKIGKYSTFEIGSTVLLLFRKSKITPPGILGYCQISGKLTKTSLIPEHEKELIYDRNLLQLPVNNIRCSVISNIIDEDVLNSLPIMNEFGRYRIYRECKIIEIPATALQEINEISKFWYVWKAQRSVQEVEEFKNLYIHLLREKIFYDDYLRISKGITKCVNCGIEHQEFEPYSLRFFEFHEKETHKFTDKYKKIDFKKFEPLCPNCHKIAHKKMITYKNHKRYSFNPSYLLIGWNTKYYKNKYKL